MTFKKQNEKKAEADDWPIDVDKAHLRKLVEEDQYSTIREITKNSVWTRMRYFATPTV